MVLGAERGLVRLLSRESEDTVRDKAEEVVGWF